MIPAIAAEPTVNSGSETFAYRHIADQVHCSTLNLFVTHLVAKVGSTQNTSKGTVCSVKLTASSFAWKQAQLSLGKGLQRIIQL